MKKIVFDMNPLGSFAISSEAYLRYYEKKFERKIYFYTRTKDGTYIRVDDVKEVAKLQNRVITLIDLGKEVEEIPFDDEVRVCPIDESFEEDEVLQNVVIELGDRASWKNSNLQIIEVADDF